MTKDLNKTMKIVLMVCAIVLVIAVSGSMIYYFVIFKPGIERAEIKLQEQKAIEEALRKESLEKCLKEAKDRYTEAYSGGSRGQGMTVDRFELVLKKLKDNYQLEIDYCMTIHGE